MNCLIVNNRKAIEKSTSTKKFKEHQMEILYLGGFKQTVYFDTGRLQGYPLCEIVLFNLLIAFSNRDWSKIGYPKQNWLPQKLVTPKKNGYPQKNWLPQKIDQKKCPPKNGMLYCERVYYWILEKWCTQFCTGLLMRFKHYTLDVNVTTQMTNHVKKSKEYPLFQSYRYGVGYKSRHIPGT